jgi:hypothetical protein
MIFASFAFDYGKRIGYPDDFSGMPWHGDFYEQITGKYMPRVRTLIAKKG